MNNKFKFAFVLEYVPNIEAAKKFYVEVLGLEVERYSPVFVQFHNFAIASDESMSDTRDPELYWMVDDAEAAFKDLSLKGEISMPLKQMPFGKVFGIKDSNGRPRYIFEPAQNRPSLAVK